MFCGNGFMFRDGCIDSGRGSRMTRRMFMRNSLAGVCALCLTGISGMIQPAKAFEPLKGFVNPTPSVWFSGLADDVIQCRLCPKQCRIPAGQRGQCGVRENRDGRGYTLAYGNPVLVQMDPLERMPFFHVRPGMRALSVSTTGCPLECHFCEVWDMALVAPEEVYAYDLPPEQIIAQAQASGVGAVAYAFGEPVVFYEYMTDMAQMAKNAGLLNLMHTSGYISPEPLKALVDKLDAVNIDLKGFDPQFYRNMTGGELAHVKHTLGILKDARVHIEITNLLIPTLNDDMDQIKAMCTWIRYELGADVPVHFARFYPLYKLANLPSTPVATLERARAVALESGLRYVYIARVTGHVAGNTFCPVCQTEVITRMGFVVKAQHLKNGRCPNCDNMVAGLWKDEG